MPVFQPLDSGERGIGGEPSCSCVIQIRLKNQIRGQEADNFFNSKVINAPQRQQTVIKGRLQNTSSRTNSAGWGDNVT